MPSSHHGSGSIGLLRYQSRWLSSACGIWHRHIKNIKMKKTEEMEKFEAEEDERIRRERLQPLWTELSGL